MEDLELADTNTRWIENVVGISYDSIMKTENAKRNIDRVVDCSCRTCDYDSVECDGSYYYADSITSLNHEQLSHMSREYGNGRGSATPSPTFPYMEPAMQSKRLSPPPLIRVPMSLPSVEVNVLVKGKIQEEFYQQPQEQTHFQEQNGRHYSIENMKKLKRSISNPEENNIDDDVDVEVDVELIDTRGSKRSSSCPLSYNMNKKDFITPVIQFNLNHTFDHSARTTTNSVTSSDDESMFNIDVNHEAERDGSTTTTTTTAEDGECLTDVLSKRKEKQEKNKSASKKYRDKKKQKHSEIFDKESDLEKQNKLLKTQIRDIENDISAFETDLAKKINTKEKIKRQVCTVLLRGYDGGYSPDDEVERNIMKRILEKITKDHGVLVKEAFCEIFDGLAKKN